MKQCASYVALELCPNNQGIIQKLPPEGESPQVKTVVLINLNI